MNLPTSWDRVFLARLQTGVPLTVLWVDFQNHYNAPEFRGLGVNTLYWGYIFRDEDAINHNRPVWPAMGWSEQQSRNLLLEMFMPAAFSAMGQNLRYPSVPRTPAAALIARGEWVMEEFSTRYEEISYQLRHADDDDLENRDPEPWGFDEMDWDDEDDEDDDDVDMPDRPYLPRVFY